MLRKEQLHFWIDLNLPRVMAAWLQNDYGVNASSFLELGFEHLSDSEVFKKAAEQESVIIITTKDIDFSHLSIDKKLRTPKVLFVNVGNVSNAALKDILAQSFTNALRMFLQDDKKIIEISN